MSTTEHNHGFLDDALRHEFGDLHFKVDAKTGMKAIIAIHNTNRGPALGGCRFIEYPNTAAAIEDAMRLARGMSYKSALANLPLGGGKSVIIKPPYAHDRVAYMHRFGEFVQELGGRYITALDSGTELSDMDIIAQHTPYIASLSCDHGDPSPSTALGVLRGIQAAVLFQLGTYSVEGLHIAIQGLGHVGYLVARHLHELGARLTVSDVNAAMVQRAVAEFGATPVAITAIHTVPCDVFSPNALGGFLNDVTIPQLQTTIVAGAANNQLAEAHHGQLLHNSGILYVPDYVINAGGVIFAANKYFKASDQVTEAHINDIQTVLGGIFERSRVENRPTSEIADIMAQEKLA